MRNLLGAMLTACIIGASTFGGAVAVAEDSNGPCLFGHVDPNNNDSACKYSDSATWPESESDADGEPARPDQGCAREQVLAVQAVQRLVGPHLLPMDPSPRHVMGGWTDVDQAHPGL